MRAAERPRAGAAARPSRRSEFGQLMLPERQRPSTKSESKYSQNRGKGDKHLKMVLIGIYFVLMYHV